MAGDGVNDALAQADVGIAVGSGSDIAAESDIVLVNSNPRDVGNLILFGKATYRKWKNNPESRLGNWIQRHRPAFSSWHSLQCWNYAKSNSKCCSNCVSTIVVAINAQMLRIRS